MKDIIAKLAMFAAEHAGSRVTWGGLYQPKKPEKLINSK